MSEEDKDTNEDEPEEELSMRGHQQGGVAITCPKCHQTFYSDQGYRQHVPNCLG